MTLLLSVLPLVIPMAILIPRNPLSVIQLTILSALTAALIRWLYFEDQLYDLLGYSIAGAISGLTPSLVAWGGLAFFEVYQKTGGLENLISWMKGRVTNQVQRTLLMGWSFYWVLEGVAGFSVPVLVGAPLIVSLGFPGLSAAKYCLVAVTVPISLGALGVPTWFGFQSLGLTTDEMLAVTVRTAFLQAVAGSICFWLGLRNLFSNAEIKKNFLWIFFGFLSCALPYVLIGSVSSEFPAAVAGMLSLAVLLLFILGSSRQRTETTSRNFEFSSIAPLVAVILFLGVLRWPSLPLKEFLRTGNSFLAWESQSFGSASVSTSLVFFWDHVLGSGASTQLRFLYNPFLFPFVFLSFWMLKRAGNSWSQAVQFVFHAGRKAKRPSMIFVSTSIFVGILSVGGSQSSLMTVGQFMAEFFGDSWAVFSPALGAFGAFISGSNTVSNLTFGPLQMEVARVQSLPKEWILALQNVGGGVGYMVNFGSLALISSALGLRGAEGQILRFTVRVMVIYLALVSLMGWLAVHAT